MDESLSHFAQATKHRVHRVETKAQVDQLRRKLVTTQAPLPVEHVYPFVDEDYQAIEFRSPGVMATYQVEPKYLEAIMDSVEFDKKSPGFHDAKTTLDEFVDQVKPPAGKELYVFMSCGRDIHEKLNHLEDYPNLINRVKSYTPHHANANQHVGQLIAAMRWPELEETLQELPEAVPERQVPMAAEPLPTCDRIKEQKMMLSVEAEPKVWNEDEMRQIPAIKQYKLEAGIRGRFPSDKVVTQMLVQSKAFPHIMGKTQTDVPVIEGGLDEVCVGMADYYPKSLVEAIVATDQAQDLYYALHDKPTDGRELVRTLFKGPAENQVHKRYGRQYGNSLTDAVKQELVKFH